MARDIHSSERRASSETLGMIAIKAQQKPTNSTKFSEHQSTEQIQTAVSEEVHQMITG
jgi:hypothetical protein